MPKRDLLALDVAAAALGRRRRRAPSARVAGLLSAATAPKVSTRNTALIARVDRPALARSLTSRPKVKHSAAGISRIASTSRKFDSGVGFSNGCAELTLKKPPPLVPSCLIATCEAAGPCGSRCVLIGLASRAGRPWPASPLRPAAAAAPRRRREVLHHALARPAHSASTNDSGSSTYSVLRVRSTQKLPIVRRPGAARSRGAARPARPCRSRPTGSSAR